MGGIQFVWGFKYDGSVCIYSVIYETYLKRPKIIKDSIPGFDFVQRQVSKLEKMSDEEFEAQKKDFFMCMFKRELNDGKRTGTFYLLPAIEGRKLREYILPQPDVLNPFTIGKFCPN